MSTIRRCDVCGAIVYKPFYKLPIKCKKYGLYITEKLDICNYCYENITQLVRERSWKYEHKTKL